MLKASLVWQASLYGRSAPITCLPFCQKLRGSGKAYTRSPHLKQPCLAALDTDGEPGDPGRFFSIVDPGSVLELVEIAETRIANEHVEALHQVIGRLSDYISRMAPRPEVDELLLRARQLVGLTR